VSVVGFATTATAVTDGGVAIISLSESNSCGGFGEAESFQFRRAWAGLILAGRSSIENPVRCTYFLSISSGARSSQAKGAKRDQQTIRSRCLPPPALVSVRQSRKPTPVKGPEPDRSKCPSGLTSKITPKNKP